MRISTLFFLSSIALVTACNGEDDTDTDMDTDTDTGSDTDTDTDTDTLFGYAATMIASDFLSGLPLEGVEFDVDGTTYTTNADGEAAIRAPGGDFSVTASPADYMDHIWQFRNDDDGFSIGTLLVSDVAAGAVASQTVALDATKGVVVVVVYAREDGVSFRSGVTVSLDAASQLSIVADSTSASMFAAGNTTLEGSSGWVIFMNTDAGAVTPTLTGGDNCVVFPGDETSITFDVQADAINTVHYMCD